MEQAALLSIIRTDTHYRFRLDLPDGPAGQEYNSELSTETLTRLRRSLQSAAQSMQALAVMEVKRQTTKLGAVNDSLLTLGRFLFESLLPAPLQESLRRLDSSLLLSTNNSSHNARAID